MSASISQLPQDQRPLSEQYRLIAKRWANADNAAHILEELKTTALEQRKSNLIEADPTLSETKAERLAKAADDWAKYIRDMCAARGRANLLKQQLKYIEMRHREWIAADANARSERKL